MKNHKKNFGATIVLSLFLLTGGYAITQAAEAKTPPPPIEEIKAARGAVIAGDYEAWAEAMENHPRAEEIVNEETFNKLLEAYALKEARFLLSNQSLCWNLAEGLKTPRILEICQYAQNCQPMIGEHSYGFFHQVGVEYYFRVLYGQT